MRYKETLFWVIMFGVVLTSIIIYFPEDNSFMFFVGGLAGFNIGFSFKEESIKKVGK